MALLPHSPAFQMAVKLSRKKQRWSNRNHFNTEEVEYSLEQFGVGWNRNLEAPCEIQQNFPAGFIFPPPYTHTHPVRHSSLPLPPFILGYGSTQKAAKLMGAIQWLLKMPSPQCRRSVTRGFLPIFFHIADFCSHLYVVLLDPAPGGLKGNK